MDLRKLFGKQKRSSEDQDVAPAWAFFMDRDVFFRFKAVLEREILKQHRSAVFNWQDGVWQTAKNSPQVRGMVNVAQICNQSPESDWAESIAPFISAVADSHPGKGEISFEQAKKILKVRLYPLDMPSECLVTTAFCDSFHSALVLDYPKMVATVGRDRIEEWGVPVHELFQIGLENVFANDAIEAGQIPPTGEPLMFYWRGDSFFSSTNALMLHRRIDFDDETGLLVIVPHRHLIGCRPVAKGVGSSLRMMAAMATEMFEEGPGSVTPDVLWLRKGQFEKVEIEVNGDEIRVSPGELAELID